MLLAGPLSAADLALQISNETAPAGSWAQIKISPATPQLMAGGRFVMKFDPAVFGSIAGVAVFSAQGDAAGIATVTGQSLSGQSLEVIFSSAAGGVGQLPHLPMFTVTVPVLASAPAGTVSAITLDASLGAGNAPPGAQRRWTDVQNNTYSVTVTPGSVTVGGNLSVRNLVPGGGLLPAGSLVRILGRGFSAGTAVSIDGVSLSNVQSAGTGVIELTLGGAADLTGKRIVVRNPDGAQVEYFSAASGVPDLPAPNLLPGIQPLLSTETWTSASVTFTERGGVIALQNPNAGFVDVILQTRSVISNLVGQTTVTLPAGALNLYDTGTTGFLGSNGFRAFASRPLRILGMGYSLDGLYVPAVFAALPPLQQLTASPAAVSFQWQVGTAAPTPVSVALSTFDRSLHFPFRATSAAPFSVTPGQTSAPATLTVAVNPVGLSPGTYSGNIVLTPGGPNAMVTTIPLSLTVSAAALLVVDPAALTFAGDYSQSLQVASNGNPVAFTAAASDGTGPHWLTVAPSSGTTAAQVTVSTRSTNLKAGVYSGQVVITGANNSVTVPVQLSVAPANSFLPPSVTLSAQTGSSTVPQRTVLVSGPGTGAAFTVSTLSGGPWLSVSLLAPTGQFGAVIMANPTGLKAGTYSGTVTLTSPDSSLPAVLPVTLVVWDNEPVLTATPSQVTYTVSPGDGSDLLPPQMVRVDSGGVPMNFTVSGMPGAVFTTPATIPVAPENPGLLGTFEYDITITGGSQKGGSQKVVVPVTTIVTTSSLVPPFLGAVVNAASQTTGAVAPGEILSVYGLGAGPSNTVGFTLDASGKVATSLNGAQVLFDGRPAPMIYGSASQANVMVPYEVAGQASTTVALQYGGVASGAWAIPVAASAPGVFTLGSAGVGAGAVLNQDNSVNSASNPAVRGSIIQIYATGEGQTSPGGVTGSVIGSDLKIPVLAVKVTIGGQDAVVQYAGSAGGSVAGLLQVNAVIPQSVTPGAAVAISVAVGGVSSQGGVTIAVK